MECVTCVCVWLGAAGVGGEWVTGLGLGFTRLYFVILLKNVEKIFDWH